VASWEPPSRGTLIMAIDIISARVLTAPARALECTVASDVTQAEALRPEWSELLERSERNELTQSPDWLLTWWRVFGGLHGRQLRLGLFHEGERLVGLAPLLRRRHWYRGLLPFCRLEFLASGEPPEDGIYSNHLGVLAERGAEEKVAHCLVEAIAGGACGSWDEVVLPMMSGDTAMPDRLVEAFRAAGYSAEATVTAGAPYISLPATWAAYLRSLSANSRRNLERSLKAFDKWSQGTTELECISSSAELEKGKSILMSLHHERWSSADQTGVFRLPLFLGFHDRMMGALAERGSLELLILRGRGEPVAAFYSMVWAGKVYAYQTGRRTDLPRKLRAGGVMLSLAIRRAIEKGRREFDLLADEAFYKSQLTAHTRPLIQVRATRTCIVEAIRKVSVYCLAKLRRLRRTNADAPSVLQ
jgi:CelD/BcsL family acetyltransferase involved in cellulose biosynthesis